MESHNEDTEDLQNKVEGRSQESQKEGVHNDGEENTECAEKRGGNDNIEKPEGEPEQFNLDNIPVEVLLQIFNFVDATDLLRNVSLVSKYFYNILSNEMTWKIKMEKRWGGKGESKYPPIELFSDDSIDNGTKNETENKAELSPESPPEIYSTSFKQSTFPWSRASVKREEQIKLWSNKDDLPQQPNSGLVHATINSHIGCIDSIHLFMKNEKMLLACGSRDRTISLWNVEQVLKDGQQVEGEGAIGGGVSSTNARIKIFNRAHDGWIWDFGVNSDHLFSCSWDMKAKIWNLSEEMKCVGEYKSNAALLSISSTFNLTAIGTFNRKILLLDPRTLSSGPIKTYTVHTRSVLSVGLDSNYVISCGEDGTCVQHDLRGNGIVKSLKLLPTETGKNPYPTCMSFRDTKINLPYFYIGDNVGSIHLVDLLKFKVVKSYKSHSATVRGVFHNMGSVLSCSRDGKLLVRDPSLGLKGIGTVDVGDKIELPCVHSLNNVVACGGGDGVVRVWGELGGAI